MIRSLFALLLLAASIVHAEVTPLPGSTPQQALRGDHFPNAIAVRVTYPSGLPASGVEIRYSVPPGGFGAVDVDDRTGCYPDLGTNCRITTDADGVAEIRNLYARFPGNFTLTVLAFAPGNAYLGSASIVLTTIDRPPARVLALSSGDGQKAVLGTRFAQPLVVRLVDDYGQAVASETVAFLPTSADDNHFGFLSSDPSVAYVQTDASGYAVSPPIAAGYGLGQRKVTAYAYDARTRSNVWAYAMLTTTNSAGGSDLDLQDMWWSGSAENGWGMSIVKHGNQLFNVLFVYDDQGHPTWYVQPGGEWTSRIGSDFAGPVYSPRSAPWFAYDASRFAVGKPVGFSALRFKGPDALLFETGFTFNFTTPYDVRLVSKRMVRQDFTGDAPSPLQGVGDMWWGGVEQNGWGVAIQEQFGGLFAVWFTYEDDGTPTWFVMPGGEWRDASTYAGTMYRTSSSPWVATPYDASKLKVGAVGPYVLRFQDSTHATLEYSVFGRTGTLSLTRQPF